ncbi:hypothetical protein VTK26DRAFT_2653 [Humicola hyalothermophila]
MRSFNSSTQIPLNHQRSNVALHSHTIQERWAAFFRVLLTARRSGISVFTALVLGLPSPDTRRFDTRWVRVEPIFVAGQETHPNKVVSLTWGPIPRFPLQVVGHDRTGFTN